MGLTITNLVHGLQGNKRVETGTIAFDSSYPTGGESLTPNMVGLGTIESIRVDPKSGFTFEYDYSGQKLLVFNGAVTHAHDFLVKGGTAAAGTDALNIKTVIVGKEAVTDATALGADSATKGGVISSAAAAGTEVANGTSLATLTGVRFSAIGY